MNLKAEPLRGDFLKSVFPAVVPAYHMNKTHWIGPDSRRQRSEADILSMIPESYQLTGA